MDEVVVVLNFWFETCVSETWNLICSVELGRSTEEATKSFPYETDDGCTD